MPKVFGKRHNMARVAFGFAGVALLAAGWGCKPKGASSAGGESDAALIAAGKTAFETNACARCHSLNGQGGRMGPDLTHAGTQHPPDWIEQHIRNPKIHNPGSRMPSFEGRIDDKGLKALSAYLASMK